MRPNISEQLLLVQSLLSKDYSRAEALYVAQTVMALHALGELSQLEKADPVKKIGLAFLELIWGRNRNL